MKNFALIGSAGFVAERHMRAVKETGNRIVAATDIFDVMGKMDSFFPQADFFLDFNKFQHFVRSQRSDQPIHYMSICTPNYLHLQQILFGLNNQANVICEKPLVLHPEECDQIEEAENTSGRRVFNLLQLRLHPSIIALKEEIENGPIDKIYNIDLTYITSRGKWYDKSWKGDVKKSGGVAFNIGIHFFDMLQWIFGGIEKCMVHLFDFNKASGYLELKKARVRWFLSLDFNDIPKKQKLEGKRTFRSILVDGMKTEFSDGFTDLHTKTYQHILEGNGFGVAEAKPSILIAYKLTNSKPIGLKGDYHPFLK